ncbi:MAG: hypothetical protein P1V97_23085 [Planctomycetota bacterium]|nr:hypothetical protein [Planctomycetota bacterium]
MTVNIPLNIENGHRERILGRLQIPTNSRILCPTVILVPGLFGQAPSKCLPIVCQSLLKRGIAVVEYKSLSTLVRGARPNNRAVPTLSERSQELAWVTTHLFERMFQPGNAVDIRKIGVFGHGFGAAVALHRASRDTRLRAAALSSPMAESDTGFPREVLKAWSQNCDAQISQGDGQILSLPRSFQIDWRSQGKMVISKAAEDLKVPLALVSGTAGREDYISDARRLYFRQPKFARLRTFDADEHFEGSEDRLGAHIASFFEDQWPDKRRAPPAAPNSHDNVPKPRIVL